MQRIEADAEGFVRPVPQTAEIYLSHALQWANARGIAPAVMPAYVAIYVQACTQDFLAAVVMEGLQEVADSLQGLRDTLEAQG